MSKLAGRAVINALFLSPSVSSISQVNPFTPHSNVHFKSIHRPTCKAVPRYTVLLRPDLTDQYYAPEGTDIEEDALYVSTKRLSIAC